ncbi:MAG: sulfatase-like hydrolase/transferase [Candidatus Omnitrophica bacterium]|nr:sulfatase-like hydrolase/transferase [Candidatus Omnitrophota bacterium]
MPRAGSFLILLGIICFSANAHAGDTAAVIKSGQFKGYNVLLVSFDALQAGHVGCLGYSRNTTPTIDSFAGEGFLFKNAVSQASWTVPATMSYFTSLYPSQHRCVNKYSVYTDNEKILTSLKDLSPETVTLAEVLKNNGYATGGFTGDAGVSGHFGFGQGFDTYFDGPKFGGMDTSIPEALKWLRSNHNRKFFIFLHGYDCHGQYDPPNGFTRRYLDFNYTGPLKGGKEEQGRLREDSLNKNAISLTEQDAGFWRSLYDEKINDVDERFRQFIEALRKMGVLDKTVIILVSDHGTEFYEHKRFDHGHSLYDELIRVPLIFRLPGIKKNAVIPDQVRGIDIMPTVLDLIGIKITGKVKNQAKGVSLRPLMNGEKLKLDAYSETDYRFYTSKRSIRTADGWKLIYTMETGKKELYNLQTDPAETVNRVADEQKTAYELEQKLFAWMRSMGQGENYHEDLLRSVLRIKEY